MATQQANRPERPPHPDRLWIWEKHVYLDEFRRSWLPIVVKGYFPAEIIEKRSTCKAKERYQNKSRLRRHCVMR